MQHLITDMTKLSYGVGSLLTSFTVKGRLFNAIRVSRPNWSEAVCASATQQLKRQGIKGQQQFSNRVDYLSYLDVQLTRYNTEHPVVKSQPIANELELKRWQQRWAQSRRFDVTDNRVAYVAESVSQAA